MKKKKRRKKKPNVWRSDRSTKLTQSLPYDTGISFVLTSSFSTHFGVMGKKNENFHELKKNFFRFTRSIVVKVKCVHIQLYTPLSLSLFFLSFQPTQAPICVVIINRSLSLSRSFIFLFKPQKFIGPEFCSLNATNLIICESYTGNFESRSRLRSPIVHRALHIDLITT